MSLEAAERTRYEREISAAIQNGNVRDADEKLSRYRNLEGSRSDLIFRWDNQLQPLRARLQAEEEPSLTALATFAVIASAAATATRNGTRRCWATGTIAAVLAESKAPSSIWAP